MPAQKDVLPEFDANDHGNAPLAVTPPATPGLILVVGGACSHLDALRDALRAAGHRVNQIAAVEELLKPVARVRAELVILDVGSRAVEGLEMCRCIKSCPALADVPVVLVTAHNGPSNWAAALAAGALERIVKPFDPSDVLVRLETHLRASRLLIALQQRTADLERANRVLRCERKRRLEVEKAMRTAGEGTSVARPEDLDRWNLAGFVGRSPAMQRIVQAIRTVIDRPRVPVLITGETGTGKEMVARAIHYGGPLARLPLVTANCQAGSPAELECLLFGGGRGVERRGKFEAARGGTLVIEAPEEMPLSLQARLMEAAQASAHRGPARIIAVSTADLSEWVTAGRFRADLFYYLMALHIHIAPLRERLEDVPALATHFLKQASVEQKRRAPELRAVVLERLVSHDYPGNIRELKNTLERAVLSAGASLLPEHIVFAQRPSRRDGTHPGEASVNRVNEQDIPLNLRKAEDVLIQRALAVCGGNVCAAARLLGVNRSRLYRRK